MRLKLICTVVATIAVLAARLLAVEDGSISLHSVKQVAGKNPIDPAVGRAITPVENGQFSSVTVWQFKKGIPSHLHREHDEVIYCTEGEGIARLGSEKIKMRAGDFVVIPPNMPHGVTVTSKKPMRGISVFSPRFDGKDRIPVEELK